MRLLLPLIASLATFTARADQVQYLAHPNQALAAFTQIAENAKQSIDVATFIFEPCHPSTRVLMEILERKAHEGVKVRVLLDALEQPEAQRRNLADDLARFGIELRLYSANWDPGFDFRMHMKLMVVDGQTYIAGGRNISDPYFAMSASNANYVDRDVLVSGPSARTAQAGFNEVWHAEMTSRVDGYAGSFRKWDSFCGKSAAARIKKIKSYLSAKGQETLASAPVRQCAKVAFFSDNPDFGNPKWGDGTNTWMNDVRLRLKRSSNFFLKYIRATKSIIEMENWFYAPLNGLSDALTSLRERGVPARIITNRDMEDGPEFFRRAEEYAIEQLSQRDGVGSQQVRLISAYGSMHDSWELSIPGIPYYVHGKVSVRDRRDVTVGSFNMDSRSYSTNLESMVAVKNCPELASDVHSEYAGLVQTYRADQLSGKVPPKPEPSLLAKLFAMANLVQF